MVLKYKVTAFASKKQPLTVPIFDGCRPAVTERVAARCHAITARVFSSLFSDFFGRGQKKRAEVLQELRKDSIFAPANQTWWT